MNIEFISKLELTPKSILIVNGKEGEVVRDDDLAILRTQLEQHCGFPVAVFANCTVAVLQPVG